MVGNTNTKGSRTVHAYRRAHCNTHNTNLDVDDMVGHQLHGKCCNDQPTRIGTATGKGISPIRSSRLTEDEVLRRLRHAWCTIDEAWLHPQYYDDNLEHLRDIPQHPSN